MSCHAADERTNKKVGNPYVSLIAEAIDHLRTTQAHIREWSLDSEVTLIAEDTCHAAVVEA